MKDKPENTKTKGKIYIIDDHPIVLKGLSQYINESGIFTVCGYATDAETALRQINILHPDVVIVDLILRDLSGLDFTNWITEHHKDIKVLVHSMHHEDSFIERAFRAGAKGYVIKHEPIENILIAIQRIINNQIYVNDETKDRLLQKLLNHNHEITHDPVRQLTNREFDVFKKIGEGFSVKEIATSMRLSVKTVQTYRERIKEKLHIAKANELVHYAHDWVSFNR